MRSSWLLLSILVSATPSGWRPADPAHRWSFPRDHHVHPEYRNEWWYFTGIVEGTGPERRRLGFQVTFFRVGLLPVAPPLDSGWTATDAVMAHVSVTDVSAGRHRFAEALWRAVPLLGGFGGSEDPVLVWGRAPAGTAARWSVRIEGATFRLSARDDATGMALDLRLVPEKPVALQGPNGLSRKSPDPAFASLYASIPRLATDGTIALDGRTYEVRGESWMDQEMGSSQLAADQAGWDWYGLRLADGRDLMLYALRRKDGGVSLRSGTLVSRDGRVTLLAPEDWAVRATGTWRSEASGATYPSGWEVSVPAAGVQLAVTPELRGAENRSVLVPGLAYWEGPVRVADASGTTVGEGYVELTGYGERARPRL